jgi:hypothetical protein
MAGGENIKTTPPCLVKLGQGVPAQGIKQYGVAIYCAQIFLCIRYAFCDAFYEKRGYMLNKGHISSTNIVIP